MKFNTGNSYFVDDSTEITDLFDAPENANYDSVLCEVDGYHPESDDRKMIVNERSQKSYFIIEGKGKIYVGDQVFDVEKEDFVFVDRNKTHALEGEFKALIVTGPPFDQEDERLVKRE